MRKTRLVTGLLLMALTLSAAYPPVLAADNPAVIIEPAKPAAIHFNTLEDLVADIEITPCPWSEKYYIYRFRSVPLYHPSQITIKAVPQILEIKTTSLGNSAKTDFTVGFFFSSKNFVFELKEEKTPSGAIRKTQVEIYATVQFVGTSTFNLYDDQDKLKEAARIIEKAVVNKTPLTFVASDIWISSPVVIKNFNEPEDTTIILKTLIQEIK